MDLLSVFLRWIAVFILNRIVCVAGISASASCYLILYWSLLSVRVLGDRDVHTIFKQKQHGFGLPSFEASAFPRASSSLCGRWQRCSSQKYSPEKAIARIQATPFLRAAPPQALCWRFVKFPAPSGNTSCIRSRALCTRRERFFRCSCTRPPVCAIPLTSLGALPQTHPFFRPLV